MKDIPRYNDFVKMEFIAKGWSNDKKYYVETGDGEKLLLRVSDIAEFDRKKKEFEIMRKIAAYGVPMSIPVDFGICDNGKSIYSLLTWIDGEDAECFLPGSPIQDQYRLGLESSRILKRIHAIPAPDDQEEWESRFNRKTNIKIEKYMNCGIRIEDDDKIISYIEDNRGLLANRPQSLQHGDYHVGNMIISPNGELSIIDFNRFDFGDPWEEFNRIVWCAAASPYFATGRINGYFEGEPPIGFFRLLAFYISSNTLSSIYWAINYGQKEIDVMAAQAKDVVEWFDGMTNPFPAWYLNVVPDENGG